MIKKAKKHVCINYQELLNLFSQLKLLNFDFYLNKKLINFLNNLN